MDELPLTGAQKSTLRGLGQKLEATLKLGKSGVSPAFLTELRQGLRARELVKLRFVGIEREGREALCAKIAEGGPCVFVGAVGHTALFYRQNPQPAQRRVEL